MSPASGGDHLWIVGAGRAGLALGLLLFRSGALAGLTVTGRRSDPPAHPLFDGSFPGARYTDQLEPPDPLTGVLLAVPDDVLSAAAARLAGVGVSAGTPVLHLCGAQGAEVLRPLAEAGCATGALHPLVAIADAATGAERLRGAWWGVEADGAALTLAEHIVAAAEGQVLAVAPGGKALYHAAAVFAANYAVALLGTAERLMERAGVEPAAARAALTTLAAGAVANVARSGPAAALTGPVARGDAETLRLHLRRLSEAERALYSVLARAALGLARERGLESGAAERIERVLEEER
jgi:predicted short-subunit dehydrogenase-like oxidoreductase (DUF2520 family)